MARGDDFSTELSRALLALRKAAEPAVRQVDVVARVGISQARLSRIEQGKAVPSDEDLRALLTLYGADKAARDRLIELARDIRAGVHDERLVVQRGKTLRLQQRWRKLERESEVVRSYHPAIVIGVLQTEAYASVVLDGDAALIADRQARRQAMLTTDRPRFVLLQTEGALRFRVGSAEVMREQLDAIAEASRRPNVEFGIIPFRNAVRVTPVAGFHIHDAKAAVVGLEVAAARLTAPGDVESLLATFARLSTAALWGDAARGELARIAADTV